mgnify:CR=1 FL=1
MSLSELFFQVLTLIGGLALFLYGMNVMGDGLTRMSGGRLEKILEKLTSNPIKAVLLGAGVTAVIQSSSATTVTVVGFVNSGIMKLGQAVGIIMGANIGTTVTSWLLSLTGIQSENFFIRLLKPSSFTPILALIGIFLIMTAKQEKKSGIHIDWIYSSYVWYGNYEWCSRTAGPGAAVYPSADGVYQSNPGNVSRCHTDSYYSELFGIGRYSAGSLCHRKSFFWRSVSDHHGTEYRNLRDGTVVFGRSQ